MKRLLALLLGSSVAAVSLPTFASVSHVFVSNRGDNTMSLIKCVTSQGRNPIKCEEVERVDVGFGTSWPANQYRGHPAWWWTDPGGGKVVGLKAKTRAAPLLKAKNTVYVDTYDLPGVPEDRNPGGANFIGISPDGRTAWNSAREVDEIQEIDTDPDSPTFGTVVTRIPVPLSDFAGPDGVRNGRMRPCDATITPDGRFFIEPDLGGETVTIVDTLTKQVAAQIVLDPVESDSRVGPFMATTNGKIVLVENIENTYDVLDISDPFNPVKLKKITAADGLGVAPQTSEFTPDGRYAYLIMNGLPNADPGEESRIDVLDVMEGSGDYLQIVASIELPENCLAHTGDFSNDGRYFFVNCSGSNQVAVIDTEETARVMEIAVGPGPRGVVVR